MLPHLISLSIKAIGRAAIWERPSKTQERFAQVVGRVEGFESSFGIECRPTVHWFLVHHAPESLGDMMDQIHGWNKCKKRFTPE